MTDSIQAPPPRRRRRRPDTRLKVSGPPDKLDLVRARARQTGLSVSAYLLALGVGHRPRPVVDVDHVRALAKINADQGRLGGLLKAWLVGHPDVVQRHPDAQTRPAVRSTLRSIEETQQQMREAIATIVARRR